MKCVFGFFLKLNFFFFVCFRLKKFTCFRPTIVFLFCFFVCTTTDQLSQREYIIPLTLAGSTSTKFLSLCRSIPLSSSKQQNFSSSLSRTIASVLSTKHSQACKLTGSGTGDLQLLRHNYQMFRRSHGASNYTQPTSSHSHTHTDTLLTCLSFHAEQDMVPCKPLIKQK